MTDFHLARGQNRFFLYRDGSWADRGAKSPIRSVGDNTPIHIFAGSNNGETHRTSALRTITSGRHTVPPLTRICLRKIANILLLFWEYVRSISNYQGGGGAWYIPRILSRTQSNSRILSRGLCCVLCCHFDIQLTVGGSVSARGVLRVLSTLQHQNDRSCGRGAHSLPPG